MRDTVTFFGRGYGVLHTPWVQDLFPWESEQSNLPSVPLDPLYPGIVTLRDLEGAKRRYEEYRNERRWVLEREEMEKVEERQRKMDAAWKLELKRRTVTLKPGEKKSYTRYLAGAEEKRRKIKSTVRHILRFKSPDIAEELPLVPPIPDKYAAIYIGQAESPPQPKRIPRTKGETNSMVERVMKGLARSNGRLSGDEIDAWKRIARRCADNPTGGGNTLYDTILILQCCSKALANYEPRLAAAIQKGSDALNQSEG